MLKKTLGNDIWYWFVKRTLQLLWVILYGVRVNGLGNIPSQGGVLLVSNHQSHFDPPLLSCCCTRRVNQLAKKSLFNFGPFAWFIRSLGAFPVDRKGSALGGVRETMRRLKQDKLVLMFPEGKRCFDGKIGDFMSGFTMIAVRSNVAILPVAVEGPFRAWPRIKKMPCLGPRIHVIFGEPIMPEDIPKYNETELAIEVERRVRECHRRLLEHPDYAG